MTVYVDGSKNKFGRMNMCHMLADTREELFAMAERIGVALHWYQDFSRASCPHFDIAQSKRKQAIAAGAVVIARPELTAILRRIKTTAAEKQAAGQPHGWEVPK